MHTTKRGEFLAIDQIHESTTNPRRTFDEAKLYELVSIPSAMIPETIPSGSRIGNNILDRP